jgi:putative polymerase
MSFNLVLCFLNANVTGVGVGAVIGTEAVILAMTFLAVFHSLSRNQIFLIGLVVTYTLALALVRYANEPAGGIDVKLCRDFLIPIAFFALGTRNRDPARSDLIVGVITAFVLAVALFEYFFLDLYTKYLNVAGYYIARGTLNFSNWALRVSNGLMVSGIRPQQQGRELLPFLGNHRVSSIFLEPNSLGNFGVMVALWAAVRSQMERRAYVWLFLGGLAAIILSDTRVNAAFLMLGLFMILLPARVGTAASAAIVVGVIVGLIGVIITVPHLPDLAVNDFSGRMSYSARVLADFDIANWFGFKASALQTFDSGYGYMISGIGLIGLLAFWGLFLSLAGDNPYFYSFRNALIAYFAILFCIAESQLSIKTASLLWFLMGALSVAPDRGSERIPAAAQSYARTIGQRLLPAPPVSRQT